MVKGDMIRNGEFDKIRELTKEASTCFVVSTVPAPTIISGYFSLIKRMDSSAASVRNVTSAAQRA